MTMDSMIGHHRKHGKSTSDTRRITQSLINTSNGGTLPASASCHMFRLLKNTGHLGRTRMPNLIPGSREWWAVEQAPTSKHSAKIILNEGRSRSRRPVTPTNKYFRPRAKWEAKFLLLSLLFYVIYINYLYCVCDCSDECCCCCCVGVISKFERKVRSS